MMSYITPSEGIEVEKEGESTELSSLPSVVVAEDSEAVDTDGHKEGAPEKHLVVMGAHANSGNILCLSNMRSSSMSDISVASSTTDPLVSASAAAADCVVPVMRDRFLTSSSSSSLSRDMVSWAPDLSPALR